MRARRASEKALHATLHQLARTTGEKQVKHSPFSEVSFAVSTRTVLPTTDRKQRLTSDPLHVTTTPVSVFGEWFLRPSKPRRTSQKHHYECTSWFNTPTTSRRRRHSFICKQTKNESASKNSKSASRPAWRGQYKHPRILLSTEPSSTAVSFAPTRGRQRGKIWVLSQLSHSQFSLLHHHYGHLFDGRGRAFCLGRRRRITTAYFFGLGEPASFRHQQ